MADSFFVVIPIAAYQLFSVLFDPPRKRILICDRRPSKLLMRDRAVESCPRTPKGPAATMISSCFNEWSRSHRLRTASPALHCTLSIMGIIGGFFTLSQNQSTKRRRGKVPDQFRPAHPDAISQHLSKVSKQLSRPRGQLLA